MVCGTMNPSSSSEPTASRCWAPWTAASTKSARPSAAPGDGQRGGDAGGAVRVVRPPGRRARHHRPVQAGLGAVGRVRSSASPPVVAIASACSPPAQIAASTTPACPRMRSVTGRGGPRLDLAAWCSTRPGSSARRAGRARPAHGPGRAAAARSRRRPARRTATVRSGRPPRRRAGPRSRLARSCSAPVSARYWRDLGQHRGQPADAGVQPSRGRRAVPAAGPSSGTIAGSHGPSSSRSWLQNPRTRRPRPAPGTPPSPPRAQATAPPGPDGPRCDPPPGAAARPGPRRRPDVRSPAVGRRRTRRAG